MIRFTAIANFRSRAVPEMTFYVLILELGLTLMRTATATCQMMETRPTMGMIISMHMTFTTHRLRQR